MTVLKRPTPAYFQRAALKISTLKMLEREGDDTTVSDVATIEEVPREQREDKFVLKFSENLHQPARSLNLTRTVYFADDLHHLGVMIGSSTVTARKYTLQCTFAASGKKLRGKRHLSVPAETVVVKF